MFFVSGKRNPTPSDGPLVEDSALGPAWIVFVSMIVAAVVIAIESLL